MSAAVPAAIQWRFELICHRAGVNIILDVAVHNSQNRRRVRSDQLLQWHCFHKPQYELAAH
jgi:hypothetical protein